MNNEIIKENIMEDALTTSAVFDPNHLQLASQDIWRSKYQLKTSSGTPVDHSVIDTFERVAEAIANVETTPAKQKKYREEFLWALMNGAVPAGRIISNAGADEQKPTASTINCTVSATIEDSMQGIVGEAVSKASLTLKAGCGIGYDFSTIRPDGGFVAGAGATTSGPLPFMDIFDTMCKTVSSSGGRRGAQMGTIDCQHPDIMEFIKAKREDGRLRQFNLSILITDPFMEAVKADADWQLVFPTNKNEISQLGLNFDPDNNTDDVIWREWPLTMDGYIVNHAGETACKIYKTIRAKNLWNMIMNATYDYAEPGFILIDKVNEYNNNWFAELIRATNPCGEQPLPPNGSCLLGSINLTAFVSNPFTAQANFDWERFKKVVRIFTRMLDNVVEINGLPLPEQVAEIENKRRHGMGYLGLGSAMTMLGMKYGKNNSVEFTREVTKHLALEGWREATKLAKEKGGAPFLNEMYTITGALLRKRPELAEKYKLGDQVKGVELHVNYSRYMKNIVAELGEKWVKDALATGLRFTHHSSIAPTGTIALSLGNNASNGIEPSFAHDYKRNVIVPGKSTKQQVNVRSAEVLAYERLMKSTHGADWELPMSKMGSVLSLDLSQLPESFVDTSTVTPSEHVAVQAAAQQWIDSSISKTVNIPTEFPFENFENVYLEAYTEGLKGCTTFRFNPENFSGVLVNETDLANTEYQFTVEGGEVITVKGNETVIYEGQEHIASNLFEAIKEGQYGRF
jgi:ribonucleoside-diphosphate reductase alpha chain